MNGEGNTNSPPRSPSGEETTNLERFLVPALHLVAISGLAFTLIVVIISRSPYTHGNLNPSGYDRTEIAVLGQTFAYPGFELAHPEKAVTGDAARDGSFIFLEHGCASCHGLKAQGGVVGPKLKTGYSDSQLQHAVREATGGMPSYAEATVDNGAIAKILAFLKSTKQPELGQVIGEHGNDVHLGLVGMQERAKLVGGALEIETQPYQGTKVTVTIPCSASTR